MFLQYKKITADLFKYSCTHAQILDLHKSTDFGPNLIISVNFWRSKWNVVCNYFDKVKQGTFLVSASCAIQTFLFKHNTFQLFEK